jgi:Flp pilus assembly protein TadD
VVVVLVGVAALGFAIHQKAAWNRTLRPVREAIAAASATGLRYPEVREPAAETETRPPSSESSAALARSLSTLRARFEEDPSHSPDTAFWLAAGLTTTGNLKTARGVVDIARVHTPFDQRLWNLDAILTVAEGDRALARERLETLTEMFPDNALARENLRALGPETDE